MLPGGDPDRDGEQWGVELIAEVFIMKKAISFLVIAILLAGLAAAAAPDKVRVFLETKGHVDLAGAKVVHDLDLLDDVIVIEVSENALEGILKNPNVVGYEFDAEVTIMAPPGACSPWPACKDDLIPIPAR